MKNLENAKVLNDMEMAMAAGGKVWLNWNLEKDNGCFLEKPSKAMVEDRVTRLKKPGS